MPKEGLGKETSNLNEFYGYVYRFAPFAMYIFLFLLLIINAIIKYFDRKNILDCFYLEIPFVFLKNLFGLGHEFDFLIKKEHQQIRKNKEKIMNNVYNRYVKKGLEVAKEVSATLMEIEECKPTESSDLKNTDKTVIPKGSEKEAVGIKETSGKNIKFLKLYLQFVVHFFFTLITIIIFFIQILIPIYEAENQCNQSHVCFTLLKNTRESFNCLSINSTNNTDLNYICQWHDLETFSEFLTDIGAFSGIITIIFKMHSYTLLLVVAVKLKFKQKINNNSVYKLWKWHKMSENFELGVFIVFVFVELGLLMRLVLFHSISEQLMIEYRFEEFFVYGGLLISLFFTANLIERRLYKVKAIKESKLHPKIINDAKSTMKKNFIEIYFDSCFISEN